MPWRDWVEEGFDVEGSYHGSPWKLHLITSSDGLHLNFLLGTTHGLDFKAIAPLSPDQVRRLIEAMQHWLADNEDEQ